MKNKNRIKKLLDFWVRYFGLTYWKIEIEYKDYIVPGESGNVPVARTFADWRYLSATIEINISDISGMKKEELEKVIVHELLHIIVNELREKDISHEERVVSELTNASIWLKNYKE